MLNGGTIKKLGVVFSGLRDIDTTPPALAGYTPDVTPWNFYLTTTGRKKSSFIHSFP
jgi:hypothetical protein